MDQSEFGEEWESVWETKQWTWMGQTFLLLLLWLLLVVVPSCLGRSLEDFAFYTTNVKQIKPSKLNRRKKSYSNSSPASQKTHKTFSF
jgi:hypothetical protein